MHNLNELIVEQYQIFDGENRPIADTFSDTMLWVEHPGGIVQRGQFDLPSDLRTDGIMKPGLYFTIVLEGYGKAGPHDGAERLHYAANHLVALALREPLRCEGRALQGAVRAVGFAFPYSSLVKLNLETEFLRLFHATERPILTFSAPAMPRITAIASEILTPAVDGMAGELLLSAQMSEVLARGLFALRHNALDAPVDGKRALLQGAKDMMDGDLRYPWSIAELALRAGTSRRTFNTRFRLAYGVSAIDYLRTARLEAAREALIYENLTVTEAADRVGYTSPANFATAFRRHFGYAPSTCRGRRAEPIGSSQP